MPRGGLRLLTPVTVTLCFRSPDFSDHCLFVVYNPRWLCILHGMKISLKVEYACRVLAQLGRSYGDQQLPHIEDLAQAEDIPANYLVQILNELRNNGLIVSRRGKQGGYALARPPADVTLADIIRAIDGDLLEFSKEPRGASGNRVAHILGRVAHEFEEAARSHSVEDLIRPTADGMYFI